LCPRTKEKAMVANGALQVESLTQRERQMADAVSRGLRNREIAVEFGISEETVKKHLATIYGKLAIKGRVQLAVYVWKGGVHNDMRAA
jgi:DNA-binding CsgD family transcriptional regulator